MHSSPTPERRRIRPRLEELEPRRVLAGFQPTAQEQMFLELLNDARANPAAYGASIGVDLSYIPPAPPLAMEPTLVESARLHSIDMSVRNYVSHYTPEGFGPYDRMIAAGYPPGGYWEESIAAGAIYPTPADALRALITDAGEPDLGHRYHLLGYGPVNDMQEQVGIGIVQGGPGLYQNYYTIDTAVIPGSPAFLTGVVYSDANANGAYDPGEGLAGVTITVADAGSTVTLDSGGYSIPLGPGTYTVAASGGLLPAPVTQTVTIGANNVRLDFRLDPAIVNAWKAWVGELYQALLNRPAAPGEVAAAVTLLEQGTSQGGIVATLLASPEHGRQVLIGMYQQYLHRSPSGAELAGLTALAETQVGESVIRQVLLASDEFWNVHGATAAGYVEGLYEDVLGRPYGTGEADVWISMAQAGNRAAVAGGIINSPEADTVLAAHLFQTYLSRSPSIYELNAWVLYLETTGNEQSLVVLLLASGEYFADSQT
jgi:uncharacterized protein YkwD